MVGELKVEYFAAARELCGTATEQIALPQAELGVPALLALLAERHPRLSSVIHRMRLAVNGELVGANARVRAGDEVAVLPPVAGGADACEVRDTPLSVEQALAAVSHPGAGGVALFVGVVRDHADGKPVSRLDYEAHPTLASQELGAIAREVCAEVEGARVAIQHRVGQLAVGELAVVVAASAPHRAEAFAACREAIERVKQRVPIWKKEWAPDGSANWVNLEGD
jgi:molybdopterin converting factor subunit 1